VEYFHVRDLYSTRIDSPQVNIRAANSHIPGYLCRTRTDPEAVPVAAGAVAVAIEGLTTDEDEAPATTLV
jgi:hypothetical protein